MSRSILVIDDQELALKQVIINFPAGEKSDIVFRHVDTVGAFDAVADSRHFVVFLDFFLSKDREYGSALIPKLNCEHLVCFSSKKEMSDHMREIASTSPNIDHVYSLAKPKNRIVNEPLARVLAEILRGVGPGAT